MSCSAIQVSLDSNCEAEITWDLLMEGNPDPDCLGPFEVVLFYQNGDSILTSPFVTNELINETIVGKLIDSNSGNFCESDILVEDKLAPSVTCIDTLISCFDSITPIFTGFPEAMDNCGDTSAILTYIDNISNFNCHLTDTISIINRLWTATDSSNNSASCIQKIYVERPSLDSIAFPADLDNNNYPAIACSDPNTDPAATGVPHFNGISVDSMCSFATEFTDVTVPICEGSYSIFREWEVFDACHGQSIVETQLINVMDTVPPNLTCPADVTVNTSNLDCTATVILPQPLTNDSCSTNIEISVEGSFGTVTGTTIYNLPYGLYETTCLATDDCGNTSSCLFNISVEDNVPPVAVSVSSPNITLLPQGLTYVTAATFDDGSWDNCGNVSRAVRRLDSPFCPGDDSTPFDTIVPFSCCDIGNLIEIELMVTDIGGNSSLSTTYAQVFDNLNPGIVCPPNNIIDCLDDYEDLTLTGEPMATDNCPNYEVSYTDSVDISGCGTGTVLRTWKVVDGVDREAECLQTINIENTNTFYVNETNANDPNDDVIWPSNYTAISCGGGLEPDSLPSGYDYPETLTAGTCNIVAISYTDTWLLASPNACVEGIRNWILIDWCQYNPVTQEGLWQYGQIIKITNSDYPVFEDGCDFEEISSFDQDCENADVSLKVNATDDCTEDDDLNYQYEIDLFADGSIDFSGEGNLFEETIEIGTHLVIWKVEDHCGNESTCTKEFSIVDGKRPTPYCQDLIVEIMDSADPQISVSPEIFDAGSYDNCTSDDNLRFSFSDDPSDIIRTYNCDHIGGNPIQMWVTDENDNQDYCNVKLEVQENNNACSSTAQIAGTILTLDGKEVEGVVVNISQSNFSDSIVTNNQGAFTFEELPLGGDFSISPIKDFNYTNGVSTFDLVLITRHILGIAPLDSPYKIIAADVNNSGTVSTFDLVSLRKLILVLEDEFPNNTTSWRFIDGQFDFADPTKPLNEDFPEIISINNLEENTTVHFVGVKVGDVNGSADVSELFVQNFGN